VHDESKDKFKDFEGCVEGVEGCDPCMMKARTNLGVLRVMLRGFRVISRA